MNNFIDRLFPLHNVRNIRMFYILSAVYNAWFVSAVWVFIWGAFMTKTQIGVSDAITFAIGFMIELPSGVWADVIGRRKAILIGNIFLTIGNFFVALSSSFIGITSWYLLWTIGYAFQSGATEALAYDSLKKRKLEDKWSSVISTSTVISRVTSLICTVIGGYLFTVHLRLPYLAFAVSGVIGIIAAYKLKEIPVHGKINRWSVNTYLKQIKDGISVLLRGRVFPIALLSLTTLSMGYMYNWGLLRPLTGIRFGYTEATLPLLLAVVSISVVAAIYFIQKLLKVIKSEKLIIWGGVVYSFIFLLMGLNHSLIVGGLIMILVAIGLALIDISFSSFINKHTEAHHRATTLSAVALFTKLPYVLLALLIGRIAENNQLPVFTIIVGGVALCVWLFSILTYRNTTYSKI